MNEPSNQVEEKLPPLFDPTQDLAPTTELEQAQIRDLALNTVENLQRTAIKMQDNASETGRWILASLLALNTGGAVAVLSSSNAVVGPLGPPVVSFAIGAVFAIGTGVNALVTAMRMGPVITDVIERLRLSAFEGTIHAATRQRFNDMRPILAQQTLISSALTASSLVAFGVGVALAVT